MLTHFELYTRDLARPEGTNSTVKTKERSNDTDTVDTAAVGIKHGICESSRYYIVEAARIHPCMRTRDWVTPRRVHRNAIAVELEAP